MNEAYAQAIKDIESDGGNYGAIGPVTGNGDRAYGAYQVMGNNIPDWTEQHYGQRLSPDEFVKNKEAQDAVFHGQFGSYVNKYGNPQDAASAWFTGQPIATNGNASDGGIDANGYVDKFNKGLAKYSAGGSGVSAISNAMGLKPRSASPALGFANEDDEEDDPKDTTGALSANNTVGPGALSPQTVMKGDGGPSGIHKFAQGLMRVAAAFSSPDQAKGFNDQLKEMEASDQSKYKFSIGKDGRIYRMDDQGNVNVVGAPGGTPHSYQQATTKDDSGRVIKGTYDRATGQYSWPQQTAPATPHGLPETLDALKMTNPTLYNTVEAINGGRVELPLASRINPQNQLIRDAALLYHPDLDKNKFTARKKFQENMTSDMPSQPGGQKVALGHALEAAANLSDQYLKLGNFPSVLGGHYVNDVKNNLPGYQEAAAKAEELANRLAGETGRLYSGNQGGGQHERDDVRSRFSPGIPNQRAAGGLDAVHDLIVSRLDQIKDQARATGYTPEEIEKMDFLGDNGREAVSRLRSNIGKLRGTKSDASAAPAVDNNALDAELKKRGLL